MDFHQRRIRNPARARAIFVNQQETSQLNDPLGRFVVQSDVGYLVRRLAPLAEGTCQCPKSTFSINRLLLIVECDGEQFAESSGAKPVLTVVRVRDRTAAIVGYPARGESAEPTSKIWSPAGPNMVQVDHQLWGKSHQRIRRRHQENCGRLRIKRKRNKGSRR